MKIDNNLSDEVILAELGARLTQRSMARSLSQVVLAVEAGISKRTVERIEAGGSVQLVTLIRLCPYIGFDGWIESMVAGNWPKPYGLIKGKASEQGPTTSKRSSCRARYEA